MKLEVGRIYETKQHGDWECIAVTDTHAWLKCGSRQTAYVWTRDGNSLSLGTDYDLKPIAREYWIDPDDMTIYGYPIPCAIHVREVLPE